MRAGSIDGDLLNLAEEAGRMAETVDELASTPGNVFTNGLLDSWNSQLENGLNASHTQGCGLSFCAGST